jgi:hypothetical protein
MQYLKYNDQKAHMICCCCKYNAVGCSPLQFQVQDVSGAPNKPHLALHISNFIRTPKNQVYTTQIDFIPLCGLQETMLTVNHMKCMTIYAVKLA